MNLELALLLGVFLNLNSCTEISKVKIIAPSSAGANSSLALIEKYVQSLNFTPIISKNIYSNVDPFYSNTDQFRSKDLIEALLDDSSIVWCIGGGEGAIRLIPYLKNISKPQEEIIANNKNRKIFIGFSDITILHIYLQRKYSWQTIHGPMLEQIVNNKVSKTSITKLEQLILKIENTTVFKNLQLLKGHLHDNVPTWKQIDSILVGGNINLVKMTIGTSYQIDTKQKILFLEDVTTKSYILEPILDHFKQTNIFNDIKAVIFGDFNNVDNQTLIEFVQNRFANEVDFPVFKLKGVGHSFVNNPLPLNTRAVIYKNEKDKLYSLTVDMVNSKERK